MLGYFVGKNTILRQKIIFFPIAEGGAKMFGVFRVKNLLTSVYLRSLSWLGTRTSVNSGGAKLVISLFFSIYV